MRDAKHDEEVYYKNFSKTVRYEGSKGFSKGNKAEEAIIDNIRRFPSISPNINAVMANIFLGNGTGIEWSKKGTITGLKSTEPVDTCRDFAAQIFAHTFMEHTCLPYFVKWANAYNVPDNATDEWLALVMRFFDYVFKLDEKEYRLQTVAYLHRHYGPKNPNTALEIERRMKNFKDTRIHMTEAAKAYGWTWLVPTKKGR